MKTLRFVALSLALTCFSATEASADLVGWWNFDDGTASDSSGRGNHGTLENGATLSTDTPSGSGQALSLGGDAHVLVPHDSSLDITNDITITAWIKPVGNVSWDGIIAKNPSDGSGENHAGNYELRLNNNDRHMEFLWQQGGVNDTTSVADVGSPIAEGEWTHIRFTGSSGGEYQFYVNGLPTSGGMLPATFGQPNTNPLFIGNRNDITTIPFDGLIDDVRLYNSIVPEPSSFFLSVLCIALFGIITRRRK